MDLDLGKWLSCKLRDVIAAKFLRRKLYRVEMCEKSKWSSFFTSGKGSEIYCNIYKVVQGSIKHHPKSNSSEAGSPARSCVCYLGRRVFSEQISHLRRHMYQFVHISRISGYLGTRVFWEISGWVVPRPVHPSPDRSVAHPEPGPSWLICFISFSF